MTKASKPNDGWISVKTRLPENSRTVLVHVSRCTLLTRVRAGWFYEYWCDSDGSEITKPVLHWREMPEPPKGKQ